MRGWLGAGVMVLMARGGRGAVGVFEDEDDAGGEDEGHGGDGEPEGDLFFGDRGG